MSEDEARISTQDEESADVEAHRRGGNTFNANDEPVDEMRKGQDDDDDFEAHKKPTGMV
jgi:hypothetical protein